jgi:hypothetical protein
MINIYYIFCNPVDTWNLKRADCINIINQNEDKLKLTEFAYSVCKKRKADLYIFDNDGNISNKVSFSNRF